MCGPSYPSSGPGGKPAAYTRAWAGRRRALGRAGARMPHPIRVDAMGDLLAHRRRKRAQVRDFHHAGTPHRPGRHRARGRVAQEGGGLIDGQVNRIRIQTPRVWEGRHRHGDHRPVGGGTHVLAGAYGDPSPTSLALHRALPLLRGHPTLGEGGGKVPYPHAHAGEACEGRPRGGIVQGPSFWA